MKNRSSDEARNLQGIADEFWTMAREREEAAKGYSMQTARQVEAQAYAYETAAQLLEVKATEADNKWKGQE